VCTVVPASDSRSIVLGLSRLDVQQLPSVQPRGVHVPAAELSKAGQNPSRPSGTRTCLHSRPAVMPGKAGFARGHPEPGGDSSQRHKHAIRSSMTARRGRPRPAQAADVRGTAARPRASPAGGLDAGSWGWSASDMTARATATAAYLLGAWTMTTVMIGSAVYALTMLADRRQAARSAAAAKLTGPRSRPPSRAMVMVRL